MEIKGIDVSKYQGQIDWKQVKEAGIGFAMVRAGITSLSGDVTEDPRFAENMSRAAEAGIPAGVYLYMKASTPVAAQNAARSLLSLLEKYQVGYPVAFDIEDAVYREKTAQENTSILLAALRAARKGGYYPLVYASTSFMQYQLIPDQLEEYNFWIADYRGSMGYPDKNQVGMWQSGTGRVSGITSIVDLDTSYRDYAKILKDEGLNHLKPEISSWEIQVFRFREKTRADEIAEALRALGYYSVVVPRDAEWQIRVFQFNSRDRADDVSHAIRLLGYYNEVLPYTPPA